MSRQPLFPSKSAAADLEQAEPVEDSAPDTWHACPFTEAEIDAIFDAWKR